MASYQVLASLPNAYQVLTSMHRRLLCDVRGLIPSGIFLLICSNPKMHVSATGIRSLINKPAPIQTTSCQVPPPPLSFSVLRPGVQPPWIETFLPPRPYPPADRGLLSFRSFIEAGRATAYYEDQWFGFSYSDDPMSGHALTLLPIETSVPRFLGPFSSVGTERGAGGRGA